MHRCQTKKIKKNFWGGGTAPSPDPPITGEGDPLPRPHLPRRLDSRAFGARRSHSFSFTTRSLVYGAWCFVVVAEKAIMLSTVYLCFSFLYVCLSVHRITTKATNQIFVKFYGTNNPGTIKSISIEWDWSTVKVTGGQEVTIVFANNSVQTSCRRAAAAICPRPKSRQAAARSGRWRRPCCRTYKLSSDLNRQPKRPGDLDPILTFDLESDVRVTCDVGYLCANFGLPGPLCCRLRPDVREKQTDVRQTDVRRQHHCLMPPPIRGGGIIIVTGSSDKTEI